MPRSNWKGFITFGLVSIPVALVNAVDPSSTVAFRQINRKTGSPIKYKRIDAETEKEVPWDEIGKGYQYDKNTIIPVEDKELIRVAGDNARTVDIEEFVDKNNIDFLNVNKAYYLIPDIKGLKGYVILRDALAGTNKIGIAKVIISTKEYIAAVAVHENAIMLYLLHYDSEIRKESDLDLPSDDLKKYNVNTKEIDIAKKLILSMSGKWKPERYKDEYKIAVEKWVDQKAKNLPETHMKTRRVAPKTSGKMVDFVALLRKSLESNKKTNGSQQKEKSTKSLSKRKMPVHKTKSHRRTAKVH